MHADARRRGAVCAVANDRLSAPVSARVATGCTTVPTMTVGAEISALLHACSRALGMRVIFRDFLDLAGLDQAQRWHLDPACMRVKENPERLRGCVAFCAGRAINELARLPSGRVHTCPFGHTEIAVPVHLRGQYLGLIYAGPLWTGKGQAPRPGLVAVDGITWIADRHLLLRTLALQIAEHLDRHLAGRTGDRRGRILAFVERCVGRELALADLATHLGISTSRCGHLVKELFGTTFPALVRGLRLTLAMRRLSEGDDPVADVARRLGFRDSGYFSRVFRREHGCTPQEYRRRQRDSA